MLSLYLSLAYCIAFKYKLSLFLNEANFLDAVHFVLQPLSSEFFFCLHYIEYCNLMHFILYLLVIQYFYLLMKELCSENILEFLKFLELLE